MTKTYQVESITSFGMIAEFEATEFAEASNPVRSSLNAALGMVYAMLKLGVGSRLLCNGELLGEYTATIK